jgi:hypothetical protein
MRRAALVLGVIAVGALTSGQPTALTASQGEGLDPLTSPWRYVDIGAVGQAGTAGLSGPNGDFTVQSAGDNIWGDADSFGYVYRPCVGDCQILAEVTDLMDTSPFAKAGVMVRETLDADSTHVILDLRPAGDLEFMTRPSAGASTSFIAGATETRPTWLWLIRDGAVVTGYAAGTGDESWTMVGSTHVGLGSRIFIGLAVTSQDPSTLNSATFASVAVQMTGTHPLPAPGWQSGDIGDTGAAGGVEHDAGVFTVCGAGADIWDTADAFQYVSQPYFADGQIVARVTGVENTDPFAKAGVMVRDDSGPFAASDVANVMLAVRPAGDVELTARTSTGAATTLVATSAHDLPVWLRLTRAGATVTGSISADGLQWSAVGTTTLAQGPMDFGLAVTSHHQGVLNTSTFDTVAVTAGTNPRALPAGWRDDEVGAPGLAGDASHDAGTFTVRGAGDNIWGTADSFHYGLQNFDADALGLYPLEHVQIVARVTSVQNTDPFAKAGVMIRDRPTVIGTTEAEAAHVLLDVRPTGDIEFMSRPTAGEPTTFVAGAAHPLPVWLKLVRYHSTFTGYMSSDGVAWTTVGTVENSLDERFRWTDRVKAGLAVTSRDPGVLNTSTFDHVYILSPMMQ